MPHLPLSDVLLTGLPLALLAGPADRDPAPSADIEWHQAPRSGGILNVALVRPEDEGEGPHPVILALPWGAGTAPLVETFIDSYWSTEPARRGYYVVAPEVRGSTLVDTADEVIPAIFSWMDASLDYDSGRVVLVGASNGGRGLFFAELSRPERFSALLGLPGRYDGDSENLKVLMEKPVRLIVGALDTRWVDGSVRTAEALERQGIDPELVIIAGQGHVIALHPAGLLDWIDRAHAR